MKFMSDYLIFMFSVFYPAHLYSAAAKEGTAEALWESWGRGVQPPGVDRPLGRALKSSYMRVGVGMGGKSRVLGQSRQGRGCSTNSRVSVWAELGRDHSSFQARVDSVRDSSIQS